MLFPAKETSFMLNQFEKWCEKKFSYQVESKILNEISTQNPIIKIEKF